MYKFLIQIFEIDFEIFCLSLQSVENCHYGLRLGVVADFYHKCLCEERHPPLRQTAVERNLRKFHYQNIVNFRPKFFSCQKKSSAELRPNMFLNRACQQVEGLDHLLIRFERNCT